MVYSFLIGIVVVIIYLALYMMLVDMYRTIPIYMRGLLGKVAFDDGLFEKVNVVDRKRGERKVRRRRYVKGADMTVSKFAGMKFQWV